MEATSYALITMFLVEGGGVTPIQGQIVRWLNTMRLGTGGFISAVDKKHARYPTGLIYKIFSNYDNVSNKEAAV